MDHRSNKMDNKTIKDDEQIKKEMIDLLMEKITGGLSEKVVDYGNHPRNYGSLKKPDGYAKNQRPLRRYDGDVPENSER